MEGNAACKVTRVRWVALCLFCATSCNEQTSVELELDVGQGVSIRVPDGWNTAMSGGQYVLRPSDGNGRADVLAAPIQEQGIERTPKLVARAIAFQAGAMPEAKLLGQSSSTTPRESVVEWTYAHEGGRHHRRHRAIFLADAVVHVSCVDLPEAICEQVARSAKGGIR